MYLQMTQMNSEDCHMTKDTKGSKDSNFFLYCHCFDKVRSRHLILWHVTVVRRRQLNTFFITYAEVHMHG